MQKQYKVDNAPRIRGYAAVVHRALGDGLNGLIPSIIAIDSEYHC